MALDIPENWFLDKKKLGRWSIKKNNLVKKHIFCKQILQEGQICLGNLGFGKFTKIYPS